MAGLARGSSPLARGLQRISATSWPGCRIIPARAGFTPPLHLAANGGEDHPRSRGVYLRYWHRAFLNEGSSPLARGLRTAVASAVMARGIIPARAGFTKYIPADKPWAVDHPRSRGVYSIV